MSDVITAGGFWDREIIEQTHASWMHDARVRERINAMIGETQPMWPVDWFEQRLGGRKFERALSIGCGTGPLERDLVRRGLCKSVDAFDGSVHSLLIAEREANAAGLGDRIRYFASDFNRPVLPRRRYDIVFFHQSLHHVGKLEKLYRAVMLSLKPGGYLYLDEYVGPSRTDWNDALVAPHRAVFATLPEQLRTADALPLPIQPDDPSEALRSGEIMEQLRIGFDVESLRGYGGNLLSVLFPMIDWRRAPAELMPELMREEDNMLTTEPSYYAIVVARPAHGLRKLYASWRWFLEPKLKRVAREVRARIGR
jgi:SAM-dependent methyltransferase